MNTSRTEKYLKKKKNRSRQLEKFAVRSAVALGLAAVFFTAWYVVEHIHSTASQNHEKTASAPLPSSSLSPAPTSASAAVKSAASPSPSPAASPSASPAGDQHISFSFVGDVMWSGNAGKLLAQKGYDYPYEKVKDILQRSDLTAANLETPITNGGEKQEKEYIYRSAPEGLQAFQAAGFDVVNTANNHILDYGVKGLQDTLSSLKQAGIAAVGAGMDKEQAYQSYEVEKNGIKVAFLGFSHVVPNGQWKAGINSDGSPRPGVAETYNYTYAVGPIQAAKKTADIVVVYVHWGTERKNVPDSYEVDMAHRYIDAGADLVIGSHPHRVQTIESYKGKWIAYSLGNFIFTTNNDPHTWDSLILQADCSSTGACALQAVPVVVKNTQPKPMSAAEAQSFKQSLLAVSPG
ncbi:MAG: hypothetical protein A2189_05745, partial [Paenibacillus sp. RIFOXYA1_FULL_44_5]